MKITQQQLINMNACKDGLARFIKQTGNTSEAVDVSFLVGGLNTYPDLLWLAGKTLPKERIVRFACDCALINIERIKPYTDEYDLIVNFLHNPSAGDANAVANVAAAVASYAAHAVNRTDAADAAAAAYAAYAADAAVYAAYAAYAANAVAAAAYAANAAAADTVAAYASAYAGGVAASAAGAGNKDKINALLVELFDEVE